MTDGRVPQRYQGYRAPSLRDAMQQLFNESVWDPFEMAAPLSGGDTFPRVDVSEEGNDVVVTANVPGVDSENLDIEVDEDTITFSGVIDRESEDAGKDKQYYHYEREYGEFRRTVGLPHSVNAGEASAETKNGVVTVTIPKLEQSGKQKVKIENKG